MTRRRRLERLKVVAAILLSAVSFLAVVAWSQVSLQVDEPTVAPRATVVAVAAAPRKTAAPAARALPEPPAPLAEPAPIAEPAPAPLPPARPGRAAKGPVPRPRPAAAQPAVVEATPAAAEAAPEPKPEEPKAAAKESKKGAAGDTGKLSLDTVPATEVYFGQNKIGDTPLVEVPLPAGHHALQVINDDKGISQSIEVDIRPGQTTKKRIQL